MMKNFSRPRFFPSIKKTVVVCLVLLFVLSHPQASSCAASSMRIVSLAPNITEIIYALSLDANLVGVTSFCDFPPQAKSKPSVGGFSNPSIEAVLRAKPDVVLMASEGNPLATYRKLQNLGLKIHIFNAMTIKELPAAIEDIGNSLGATQRARDMAASIRARIGVIESKARMRRKATAVFIVQTEPLIVAGSGSHIDEAMKMLNLVNIADKTAGKYPKFSWEEIAKRDPKIILIASHQDGMARIKKKLSYSRAIRNSYVLDVGERFMRLSPRIIDAIEDLEKSLQKIR